MCGAAGSVIVGVTRNLESWNDLNEVAHRTGWISLAQEFLPAHGWLFTVTIDKEFGAQSDFGSRSA